MGSKKPPISPLVPAKADRLSRWAPGPLDRRQFLRLIEGAIAAAGLSGCRVFPDMRSLPFVRAPAFGGAGLPSAFATTVSVLGEDIGIVASTFEGKPHKLEGNPQHPASLGASNSWVQAKVLSLYDPDRLQTPFRGNQDATWDAFEAALSERLVALKAVHGRGLRVLTGVVQSPSVSAQLKTLMTRYPAARCYRHEPWNTDAVAAGCAEVFGDGWQPHWRLEQARCIVAADADFLRAMPGSLAYARAFAGRRDPEASGGKLNRLYAIEPSPSLTGMVADHRRSLKPQLVGVWLRSLGAALGVPGFSAAAAHELPEDQPAFLTLVASDLLANRGESIVMAGLSQPASVHALAFSINAHLSNLGSTLQLRRQDDTTQQSSTNLAELCQEMDRGLVDTLVILDTNPVYSAPSSLGFRQALAHVPMTIAVASHADETAQACLWRLPLSHDLETWGDGEAYDGSVALKQPAIVPLFQSRSVLEVLALCNEVVNRDGYGLVRDFWRNRHPVDFEGWWRSALQRGIADAAPTSTALSLKPAPVKLPATAPMPETPQPPLSPGFTVHFQLDPTIGDGRYANNPWLQELPKPLSGLTWSNAALISAMTAQILAVATGDEIKVARGSWVVTAPVLVTPGQAEGVITLPLGYGRWAAGTIGNGLGFDANMLRVASAEWWAEGLSVSRSGARRDLAITHGHHAMEGRDLARMTTAAAVPPAKVVTAAPPPSATNQPAWGMAIDLTRCVSCSACVTACQAENNIPAVGVEEVKRGREMHWIRVDLYVKHDMMNRPKMVHQPVPCMHCESAPCEYVCPVGATTHDHEGLNQMIYNRCVGTRYCSNNCPYKVRRFNFYHFSDKVPELSREQLNPEVSVRPRGVMEKCTYCVQRISAARIKSESELRPLRGDDVVPACAQACPTEAIVFGDLNDPSGRLGGKRSSGRHYLLLEELGTRPHTSYLAKVTNPHPNLAAEEGLHE